MTECFVIVPWVLWSHDRERIVNQIEGVLRKTNTTRKGIDSNRYLRSTAGVMLDIENIAADDFSS